MRSTVFVLALGAMLVGCGGFFPELVVREANVSSLGRWTYDQESYRLRLSFWVDDTGFVPSRYYTASARYAKRGAAEIALTVSATASSPFAASPDGLRPVSGAVEIGGLDMKAYTFVDERSGRVLGTIDTALREGEGPTR